MKQSSFDPIVPVRHGCRFPGWRVRYTDMEWTCDGCDKTWRWGGVGWTRINPDGTEWLAL